MVQSCHVYHRASTLTSILIFAIFHAAGEVSDGGDGAGQQSVHQSRTSLYVCAGETQHVTKQLRVIWRIGRLAGWKHGNQLCKCDCA